ncbi:MAG TPA: TetM/TetW/TetO/TetS family tetracycline resistance ribosomal protection protein [Candidatus Agathobaculum pullicola]|nr:TetM/TetW/TetO/TetS family tetracycline resistance ribosomal protection protein [Candidatus Agathobaculum pullicola]
MKRFVIGVLAHVDAGKTTLSEALLYLTGAVKKLGRVDHQDAFLDTFAIERERGITVFSKQAELLLPTAAVTLLDTPGHVDFSAEMERTLQVLDYAILVISGTDGVQAHTQTLWRLLERHNVPTFLFINKMDIHPDARAARMAELKKRLGDGCIAFDASETMAEEIAVCDEALLERYLETGCVESEEITSLIRARKVFPCYFGSALRLEGVEALIDGLERYTQQPQYDSVFGAQVFKITRDGQGNRLSHLKLTGGTLAVRALLSGEEDGGWQEKVNQIRVYSGEKFQSVERAESGMVCAVTGLTHTKPGMGLGSAAGALPPVLEPVLGYRVQFPDQYDAHTMLKNLRQLEEEDPQLRVVWNERLSEIHLQLMGEVQLEILSRVIAERFGVPVTFDEGSIVYKETITTPAVGIGHFEPLRHYAEVHLLLEPGERGSGLQFATACSTDTLDINWQRLILTHLAEKTHVGVLTGAPVTDIKITLLTGRAHVKHTEGGDFREATYRAVRNGLMQAESVLLEPYYAFELTLPEECVGRAMNDIQRMEGTFEPPKPQQDGALLTGTAPVSAMRNYWTEVAAYTKGRGRLVCTPNGYAPCHNAAHVIEQSGYQLEHDTENSPDSVFCSHGAGYVVKWDEVQAHAHMDAGICLQPEEEEPTFQPVRRAAASSGLEEDKELRALFERTYGPVRDRGFEAFRQSRRKAETIEQLYVTRIRADDYLLVDGYNIIFAWDELRSMAAADINAAREALINALSNYQSVRKCHLIVVFDAYKVKGGVGSVEKRHGLHIVYTKEAETADMYIEQASYDLSRKHRVRVATSDGMEQMIIMGHGAERISATELKWEVEQASQHIADVIARLQQG